MISRETHKAIAALTDEGVFEDLALSVLRIEHPFSTAIVQTGLNAEGRTHRSPVDAIGFVPGVETEHMVAVHHTITAPRGLRAKWLRTSSDPLGDVPKTIEIVKAERRRLPDLAVTLILTTSREPSEDLVRDARAAGREHGVEVDIWSASRLAHVLDTKADGQAVRRRILGLPQDRLSSDLLIETGRRTLDAILPQDDPRVWIDRTQIIARDSRSLSFLVGGSGSGKTVTCLQTLDAHFKAGGLGLVLDAPALGAAASLEEAVEIVLKRFTPTLADGRSILDFGTEAAPLLIVVDDINRSGDGPRLAARLANWVRPKDVKPDPRYRVLCPLWPQIVLGVDEGMRSVIEDHSVELPPMSMSEAAEAVRRRAAAAGRPVTMLRAREIAEALGADPLLMALHEPGEEAAAEKVIGRFIERALQRSTSLIGAPALRGALDQLITHLLIHRNLSPDWQGIELWDPNARYLDALQVLFEDSAVVSLQGPSTSAQLAFRHDRVREHLLIRAAIRLEAENQLTDDLVAEPALAEVIGGAVTEIGDATTLLARCRTLAPVALADAYRRVAGRGDIRSREIVAALDLWLQDQASTPPLSALRWLITEKLALADGPDVIRLVKSLGRLDIVAALARLRNGDLEAGIYLCEKIDPGRRALWAHRCIAHAMAHHGSTLLDGLRLALVDDSSTVAANSGALRLAGHIGDPVLLHAILEAWAKQIHRAENLGEYLWAATRCVGEDLSILDQFYDDWGALSDESNAPHHSSPRWDIGEYALKWGFASEPPAKAIPYLIGALARDDLGRHVLGILEYIDHPEGLCAVAEAWAAEQRDREPSRMSFGAVWRHMRWGQRRDHGEAMSAESRAALARLWQDDKPDDALALASFTLWEATHAKGDLHILRPGPPRSSLANPVLAARLARGDVSAIPEQVARIRTSDHPGYWWQFGRSVWSPELTALLDETLSNGELKHDKENNQWIEDEWIQSELLMRLDTATAEPLIIRHWDHIRRGSSFVQAALFHATPATLALAAEALATTADPKRVLRFTMMHFNQLSGGRGGFTRQAQVLALEPYFQFLEPSEIEDIGEACNEAGWFDLRQRVVDPTGHSGRALLTLDALIEKLEGISADKHRPHLVEFEIKRILETGWTWARTFETAMEWARQRTDDRGALLIADLVREAGGREDLVALRTLRGRSSAADRVIANAEFVVRRRALN